MTSQPITARLQSVGACGDRAPCSTPTPTDCAPVQTWLGEAVTAGIHFSCAFVLYRIAYELRTVPQPDRRPATDRCLVTDP